MCMKYMMKMLDVFGDSLFKDSLYKNRFSDIVGTFDMKKKDRKLSKLNMSKLKKKVEEYIGMESEDILKEYKIMKNGFYLLTSFALALKLIAKARKFSLNIMYYSH